MAIYTLRNHDGITNGFGTQVEGAAWHLATKAAKDAPWNDDPDSPKNLDVFFNRVQPKNKRDEPVAAKYTRGFKMYELQGAQQKWEGQAVYGSFRLDLQAINNGFANWSVQTNGRNSKTVAVCLMQVDRHFNVNQLAHALVRSAKNGQLCELTVRET